MSGAWDRIFPEQWHEGQLRLARALVDVVPYVMLAFCAVLTLVLYRAHWETGSPRTPLILCGLAGAWTLWMYTLHPGWHDRPRADVLNGTYTFAVPEYLYTSDSPSAQVSAFLSFLRSPAEIAQLAGQDSGFIPCADLKDAVADDCAVRQGVVG